VEGFGAPDVELKDAEVRVAHQLIEALADECGSGKNIKTASRKI